MPQSSNTSVKNIKSDADISKEKNLLSLEDFRALAHSGRELNKELSLEKLLQNILKTASELTRSPETSIILRNENTDTLYFAAATGEDADWVMSTFGKHSEKQVPIVGSKAGSVYKSGQSLVENIVTDHFSDVDSETELVTKSMVCVPLRVTNETLGVMQVLNTQSGTYTDRDQLILEYFSDQASVAIRNARLMESILAHSGIYGQTDRTDELFTRMNVLNQPAKSETLSVLFADMRGFTQLCQTLLKPILVQQRLSEFISMLNTLVVENNGIVNKVLGDGLMALFQGEDSSINAVQCAFAMVNEFSEMKTSWDEQSNQRLDFLDLGVGITTDEVILGGIGSGNFIDYTAIGSAVNLASAFENKARKGKHVLCDQVTYSNAKSIVADISNPETFQLKKPDQEIGVPYKCYHLTALQESKQPNVFISHSHNDREYVEQLIANLKEQGIKSWYSVTDIPKGTLWTAEIRKAISKCNWMVVVVSKNTISKDTDNARWVRREVDLALTATHLEERIIPVIIDDTNPAKVNDYLTTMQAIYSNICDDIAGTLKKRFSEV